MSKGYFLVKEAMKASPVTVKTETNVMEAASLMKKHNIGSCIVVDGKPIGIITESDIIKKVVSENKNASNTFVGEVMTTPLLVIDPYIDIEEAMKIMSRSNVRRLPVIENGKLIGIVTQKDILRLSPVLLELSREWCEISAGDKTNLKEQFFSGKCEDCGALSTNLKSIDGRLLCEGCIDALKYG